MTFEAFCRAPSRARVALLGLGRANAAVLAWLRHMGATVTVYTERMPDRATECAPLVVGPFPDVFGEEVLVRSPGIRPDIPPLSRAVARGALLVSETELLMALAPCPIIGVTGSDGKTTTASLIGSLCRAAGHRVWLGGNNGTPLLPSVFEMTPADIAVLELSSFQLMTARRAPDVAVITNVTPNHLDWHVDMTEYVAAKCRIFTPDTRLVTNAENAVTRAIGAGREGTVLFSPDPDACAGDHITVKNGHIELYERGTCRRFDGLDGFYLPGRHNLENLLAAIAAAAPYIADTTPGVALPHFRGVAHRLQYVDTVRGVRYYNSSTDTSPTRTAAALSALDACPLVIAGGRGKGVSFLPLGEALSRKAKGVYLYGEAAREIAAALPQGYPHKIFERFGDAFASAAADATDGDTVLLSPACTAFGEFRDFEQRGEVFCRLVEALAKERK